MHAYTIHNYNNMCFKQHSLVFHVIMLYNYVNKQLTVIVTPVTSKYRMHNYKFINLCDYMQQRIAIEFTGITKEL